MATTMILNPQAGSALNANESICNAARRAGIRIETTHEDPDSTQALIRQAVISGSERIIAAGGDGTVSQVVRGLMHSVHPPELAVLPLGTGNDWARSVGMPLDAGEAMQWLAGQPNAAARTDVLELNSEQGLTWALNSINGGIASQVRAELDAEQKARWGALSFAIAGLGIAVSQGLKPWQLSFQLDDAPVERVDSVVSLVVSNGRYVGGGFQLAPEADVEDGYFELVIVSGENPMRLFEVALRAKLGTELGDEQLRQQRGRKLQISAPEDFAFTVDGEHYAARNVTIELRRAALPFVAGPHYMRQGSTTDASSAPRN